MKFVPPPFDLRKIREILSAWDLDLKAGAMERMFRNELVIQGKLVKYNAVKPPYKMRNVGIKGKVFGMSNASRLNLLKKLATWDWERIDYSLFVTLTYPDERSMPKRDDRNMHRSMFARIVETELSRDVPILWRVEYEMRKSGKHVGKPCPHWHLLIPTVKWIDMDEVNSWWRRVIHWNRYCRTETVGAKKAEAAAMYIGKYLSKESSASSLVYASYHNDSGRPWGILRPEQIPLCERTVVDRLNDAESDWLLEFAEQFLPFIDSRCNSSFTLLGTLADDCTREFLKRRLDVLR